MLRAPSVATTQTGSRCHRPTPSSTATPTSRSCTGPRRSRTWPSGRPSWACPASPSPTTTGCTAWCASPPRRRRRGSARSSGSRSSCWTRRRPIPAGSSSRPGAGRGGRGPASAARSAEAARPVEGLPARPRPDARPAAGPPGGGQGGPARDRRARSAGRTSCCSRATRRAIGACAGSSPARISTGPSACRGSPRRCSPSTPRAWSRCRAAARARSRAGCGSAIARARGPSPSATRRCSGVGDGVRAARHAGFFIELSHHLLPDDDWLVAEHVALADELGLPVVVTNDVHYARPEDRELHDVLTGDLPRPDARDAAATCAGPTASRT